jgi:hypothetical protein
VWLAVTQAVVCKERCVVMQAQHACCCSKLACCAGVNSCAAGSK